MNGLCYAPWFLTLWSLCFNNINKSLYTLNFLSFQFLSFHSLSAKIHIISPRSLQKFNIGSTYSIFHYLQVSSYFIIHLTGMCHSHHWTCHDFDFLTESFIKSINDADLSRATYSLHWPYQIFVLTYLFLLHLDHFNLYG